MLFLCRDGRYAAMDMLRVRLHALDESEKVGRDEGANLA